MQKQKEKGSVKEGKRYGSNCKTLKHSQLPITQIISITSRHLFVRQIRYTCHFTFTTTAHSFLTFISHQHQPWTSLHSHSSSRSPESEANTRHFSLDPYLQLFHHHRHLARVKEKCNDESIGFNKCRSGGVTCFHRYSRHLRQTSSPSATNHPSTIVII